MSIQEREKMQSFKEYLMENIILNESKGNLSFIDRKLAKALYNDKGKLNDGFGKDSPIKKNVRIKTLNQIEHLLLKKHDIIAAVINIDGVQTAIVAQQPKYGHFDDSEFDFGGWYKDPKGKNNLKIDIGKEFDETPFTYYHTDMESIDNFKRFLKVVLDSGNKVTADLVHIDRKETKKHFDRKYS